MKLRKSKGGHTATIMFVGALVILFAALAKLLSSVEEFSQLSQTMIGFMKGILGK